MGERLNKALERFGESFEVIRENGNLAVKGKTALSKRISNPWLSQFVKEAIFSPGVLINPNDVLHDKTQDIYYFVHTYQRQTLKDRLLYQKANLLKINNLCQIQRLNPLAGGFGGVKQEFIPIQSNIMCHLREVSAELRIEKPGLLEQVEYLLYLLNSEDLKILDRIVIDDQNFQVEHIDHTSLEGLFEIELSLDKRG